MGRIPQSGCEVLRASHVAAIVPSYGLQNTDANAANEADDSSFTRQAGAPASDKSHSALTYELQPPTSACCMHCSRGSGVSPPMNWQLAHAASSHPCAAAIALAQLAPPSPATRVRQPATLKSHVVFVVTMGPHVESERCERRHCEQVVFAI